MNIGLTYNLFIDKTLSDQEPPPCSGEYDSPKTILAIENALKSLGHTVVLIDADENAYMHLYKLRNKLDFVFNIAEGIEGESRESQIPIMLEMLKIPYAGSGPLTMAITLDKARTKEILAANNIPTAPFQLFFSADDELRKDLDFPLIVKPNAEGSSIGIEADAVCGDETSFRKKLKKLFQKYNKPMLVEKFLSGREFTVPLIGNGNDIQALPILENTYENFPKMDYYINCYEAKSVWSDHGDWLEVAIAEDRITSDLKKKIIKLAIDSFKALGIRDFARIDMRMDEKGDIHIIEANPLPGLNPTKEHFSYFMISASVLSLPYELIIEKILDTAFKRCRIAQENKFVKSKNEALIPVVKKT